MTLCMQTAAGYVTRTGHLARNVCVPRRREVVGNPRGLLSGACESEGERVQYLR